MKKHLTSILLLLLPAVLIIYAPQAVRGASAGLVLARSFSLCTDSAADHVCQCTVRHQLSDSAHYAKMPALITDMQFLPSCRIFMRFSNGNSRICPGT